MNNIFSFRKKFLDPKFNFVYYIWIITSFVTFTNEITAIRIQVFVDYVAVPGGKKEVNILECPAKCNTI